MSAGMILEDAVTPPHPGPDTDGGPVESIRDRLRRNGVER